MHMGQPSLESLLPETFNDQRLEPIDDAVLRSGGRRFGGLVAFGAELSALKVLLLEQWDKSIPQMEGSIALGGTVGYGPSTPDDGTKG